MQCNFVLIHEFTKVITQWKSIKDDEKEKKDFKYFSNNFILETAIILINY